MLLQLKKHLIIVIAIAITLASACKKDNSTTYPDGYNNGSGSTPKKGIQIVADAKFGSILTDNAGRALYFFANDVTGTSTCTGGCAVTWPVYYSADASSDMNVDASQVGVITRADGTKQSTYKGYPLYYYMNDTGTKDVKGDGVGQIWYVAKPDYSIMVANAQLLGGNGKQYTYAVGYVEGAGVTKYFTDDKGRTLYAFANDKNGQNVYTVSDFSNNATWPVYTSEIKSVPSIITKDLMSVIDVFGRKQLTFKGWPLYYFGQDSNRGDNKGISGGATPGSTWPVLSAATSVAPGVPPVPTPTPNPGGGYYNY